MLGIDFTHRYAIVSTNKHANEVTVVQSDDDKVIKRWVKSHTSEEDPFDNAHRKIVIYRWNDGTQVYDEFRTNNLFS